MKYPFDPTGTNPANRIPGEDHSITTVNAVNNPFFFVDEGPYFADTLVVYDNITKDFLKPNKDFFFGHPYVKATEKYKKPIYGSIIFAKPGVAVDCKISYNTLGDIAIFSENQTLSDGLGVLDDLMNIPWESIANTPDSLPPGPHPVSLTDVEGIQDIVEALNKFNILIEGQKLNITMDDISDLDAQFATPMIRAVQDINATLALATTLKNQKFIQPDYEDPNLVIEGPDFDRWLDTGISITPDSNGLYLLTITPNYRVEWKAEVGVVEFRWIVDGLANANAYKYRTLVPLRNSRKVKLQVKINEREATRISVAGSSYKTTLDALKIGEAK